MKKRIINIFFLLALLTTACSTQAVTETKPKAKPEQNSQPSPGTVTVSLDFQKQSGRSTNQYAVWMEDKKGNFIATLYVTAFTAEKGWETRPESLPTWVRTTAIGKMNSLYVDGTASATPESGNQSYVWDCRDANGMPVANDEYIVKVEGTSYKQNGVLFTGTVVVGTIAMEADLEPVYNTEEAKNSQMISNVRLVFEPAPR